ncbi:YbjQ family protein [Amphritea pacifica]|uniref:Heavy metal-binding domain-containing protein n=1 Tax=Amphritea pacifica TaxID=2811233 RepID=A0ABS2WCE0_9GAMM|nr:heavy metal-binding domain-containing protein [Amphritea pacifica]MBN0989295.1 heavy metal-binding domain-containing protein [Amphritea pacifica]MBN1008850.1 heavy metal-binding domain-containing protein [Amphritea pacifica]
MTNLIIFLVLMTLGYLVGQMAEKKHYKSIIQREKQLRELPTIASRFPPTDKLFDQHLVMGNTVISVDYFKRFIAALRNLLGGRVTSYESLLDRARRESLLRMKQQADAMGAEYVFNVKYETASISKGRKNAIGSVEVLAYGTALIASGSGNEV